ncbi:hypothetical protein CWI38_0265p0010 [Hamiltosporidium tvaerminnensis]|uniref:Uncharacterized protein n=2 Tax=Hamiltosporidium TaxID=1176354 RepID=A0A4Q9KUU1_9MICR|nr:hypothetical protein CWI39_2471p0030 [Hamiltosporidium magnivora]TBU06051.1 hypothetical protein CWI38_2652p0020 [Hamiltosporidium tvaerminnensis]TBU06295.1 hypothetical protein CWI36_0476p0050 [Hamiltosporidium magnivora]TBU17871.1 hypothetical protein CWI38_0265p0010 [Hamiltosporidium tvaerminnensis]
MSFTSTFIAVTIFMFILVFLVFKVANLTKKKDRDVIRIAGTGVIGSAYLAWAVTYMAHYHPAVTP